MLIEQLFTDDAPVRVIAGDLLGRRTFVQSLATALLRPPGSFCRVVSLEGAWGEGKTSAIEMAIDVIGQRDADLQPFVVRINPWQFGTKEALERALLVELSKLVRLEGRRRNAAKFATIADELLKYSQALSVLKADPHSLAFLVAAKAAFWLAARRAKNELDIQSVKARVSTAIKDAGRPIIVVVDDLDRLLPAEVLEVIRFVRAVGDFEQTTYLLAFEHSKIVEALKAAGLPSPAKYLEKIVQLRTHLPPASAESIKRILDERIEQSSVYATRRVFEESESRRLELHSFYFAPLIQDVRTLLRVLARTEMTPLEVARDVEYWEIFALNVVAVVAPEVFDLIRANPTGFTKGSSTLLATNPNSAEMSTQIEAALANLPARTARYVDGLLRSLFPILAKKSPKSQSWMDHNGRVAAEKPLLTYLLSGVAEGELPLDTVRAVLTESKFRQERIAAVSQQEERFLSFVAAIRDEIVVSKIAVDDPLGLVLHLVRASASLPYPEPEVGFGFNDRAMSMLPVLVELLIREQNPARATIRLCETDKELLVSALLLEQLSSPGDESVSALRASISDELLHKLLVEFADKLQNTVSEEREFDARLGPLLFVLHRISKDEFNRVLSVGMVNEWARRTILRALANSVFSSRDGQVAVWKHDMVSEELVAKLRLDARKIVSEGTDDKQLFAAARALLDGVEIMVSTGKPRAG